MALPKKNVNKPTESKPIENNTNAELEKIKELRNSDKWKAIYSRLAESYLKKGITKEQEANFLKMVDKIATMKSVDTRSSKSLVNSFDSFSKNFNS